MAADHMDKNIVSIYLFFLLFPDCDFHFNLGLGEPGPETLFNITLDVITDCTAASPPQFLLNTYTPN